jgi:hypothetical protein
MAGASTTLHLGDQAPEIGLRDAVSGKEWSRAGLLDAHRGLLLVFHRGMW